MRDSFFFVDFAPFVVNNCFSNKNRPFNDL